jgi:hypothetical protein
MATPFRPTRPWPVRTGHGDAVRAAGDPQRSSLPPHSLAVVTNHRQCEWSRSVAVPRLAEHPVVNAAIVAELLEVSEQSARVAISKLANLGCADRVHAPDRDSDPARPPTAMVGRQRTAGAPRPLAGVGISPHRKEARCPQLSATDTLRGSFR